MDSNKKIVGVIAFIIGFAGMAYLGFVDIDWKLKGIIYACIFALLFIIAFIIYFFKTHDLSYNVYKIIDSEARSKRVNQDLIKLGVSKHLIGVAVENDFVKVTIKHNGYNSYMLVAKNSIDFGYEANDDYIRLPDDLKAQADALIDNKNESHKDFKKLDKNDLYRKFVEFNNNN